MARPVLAAAALTALVALPLAPQAAADDGHTVLVDSGKVRCQVSADNVPRGGGPMVVCQRTDGQAFAQSSFSSEKYSVRLPVAVKQGGGEFYYGRGSVPDSIDVTVNDGQTVQMYGWTIQNQGLRTRFAYDGSGHGIYINATDINQF
jgi:hypothetical protein